MVAPIQNPPDIVHGARMTADEFLQLPEHNGGSVELIEGVVVVAGGASMPHQDLHRNLLKLLFALKLDERGKLLYAPFSVRLDGKNVPEPDIFWIAPETPVEYEHAAVIGAPDLVIEILSRSTATADKKSKFAVYERNGVKEYWIADPNLNLIEVYVLRDGRYERLSAYGDGDSFESPVLKTTVALVGVFSGE